MQKKNKKKIQPIKKPTLKGRPRDPATLKRAVNVLGLMLISMFIFLVAGSVLVVGSLLLRAVLSMIFIAMFVSLAYSNGMNAGFQDVAFAEIAYVRKESGKSFTAVEEAKCYHPAKGFISAGIGILPLFLISLVLAVTTQPQLYTRSALPGWVSAFERRTEIGNALQFYQQGTVWGVTDIVRIITRLAIMPFFTLAGSDDVYLAAVIERVSPLLMLFIPAGYALGYLNGPNMRAKMHAGIAANEKKKRKRDKKRIDQKRREPKQLI